jgi:hypothetical protein
MKNTVTQLMLSASLCASSTLVMAGAVTPSPVAAPVMGPWSLGLMAGLVALIAYRIKRK